jgi:hypothetical protein
MAVSHDGARKLLVETSLDGKTAGPYTCAQQGQCGDQQRTAQQQVAPFEAFAVPGDANLGVSIHSVITHGVLSVPVMYLVFAGQRRAVEKSSFRRSSVLTGRLHSLQDSINVEGR